MQMLDKNHDGEVNFREFCLCVSYLAKCHYKKKTGKEGKGGKGGKGGKKDKKDKGKEQEPEQDD